MNFKEQFDKPLPKINKDVDKLYFETQGSFQGKLNIKNEVEGVLSGWIMSNSSTITFDPEEFSGSDNEIIFHVDMSLYNIGDTLKTDAVIMSNGGEHSIEFIVKMVPPAIETKDGSKITVLSDFYRYVKENMPSARALFRSHEFSVWLYSSGYEYMDFYEELLKDSDRDRAVMNFLAFNGYKEEKALTIYNRLIRVTMVPNSDISAGSLSVTKSGSQSVNERLIVKGGSDWIRLESELLCDEHFDVNGEASISFFIEPKRLTGNRNTEIICVGTEEVTVDVKSADAVEVYLTKEHFMPKERSFVYVKNNSGALVTVELSAADNLIKLESSRINVSDSAKIPFQIELSAIQTAQYTLIRQPELKTEIRVNAALKDGNFIKKLNLTVGWF